MTHADWLETGARCIMGLCVIHLLTETALLSTPEIFIWAGDNMDELMVLVGWADE